MVSRLEKALDKDKPYLFLIDEADKYFKDLDAANDQLLQTMRALSEKGVAYFIFAGFWEMYQSAVMDYHSPIKNFAESIDLGPLSDEACINLATIPMERIGLKYADDNLPKKIVTQSGGRANLVAIICNEILRSFEIKGNEINESMVNEAIDSEETRIGLSGWERMQDDERLNRLDRILVYQFINRPSFTLKDALKFVDEEGLNYEAEEIRQACIRLVVAFILKREQEVFTFRVPLFSKSHQRTVPRRVANSGNSRCNTSSKQAVKK